MAPCSPCMNWLRLAVRNSTPICVNSFSDHDAIADPGTAAAARTSRITGVSWLATSASGSTGVSQSSSVTLFHCDALALL